MESYSRYFIKGWLNNDIEGIRPFLSKEVQCVVPSSKTPITGQQNTINYLDKVFKEIRDNDVSVKLLHSNKSQNEFKVLYQYIIWQPELTLMVNNFFVQVISAIEPKEFRHHVSVKVKISNKRIFKINVVQEVSVLCKRPAQIEYTFASENVKGKRYDQYIQ